ncbi:phage baseplate assembly protein V [Brachyspira sp. CAG:484]|nr:phage baseplate assembly protein V [Brachyspira sp. CAG:484]
MLRFGIVSQIDPINVQARVSFEDDESTSFWLPVLQTKTLKDKFYAMPDIGEQVACLMDENSEDGVILGAIYSTEDVSTTQSEKQLSVNLEDGSYINADKENHTLIVAFSKMKLIGNIEHEGTFTNTAGIKSNADITDKTSSMQAMRDVYNSHTHTGNQGKATSAPNKTM